MLGMTTKSFSRLRTFTRNCKIKNDKKKPSKIRLLIIPAIIVAGFIFIGQASAIYSGSLLNSDVPNWDCAAGYYGDTGASVWDSSGNFVATINPCINLIGQSPNSAFGLVSGDYTIQEFQLPYGGDEGGYGGFSIWAYNVCAANGNVADCTAIYFPPDYPEPNAAGKQFVQAVGSISVSEPPTPTPTPTPTIPPYSDYGDPAHPPYETDITGTICTTGGYIILYDDDHVNGAQNYWGCADTTHTWYYQIQTDHTGYYRMIETTSPRGWSGGCYLLSYDDCVNTIISENDWIYSIQAVHVLAGSPPTPTPSITPTPTPTPTASSKPAFGGFSYPTKPQITSFNTSAVTGSIVPYVLGSISAFIGNNILWVLAIFCGLLGVMIGIYYIQKYITGHGGGLTPSQHKSLHKFNADSYEGVEKDVKKFNSDSF
jgi:hypothetical protein